MLQKICIENRIISEASPVFIIAEAGVNHNGDLKMARELIEKAAACGADCIKFQTFSAERIVTKSAPKAKYQLETTDKTESQLAMLKKIELSPEHHMELKKFSEEAAISSVALGARVIEKHFTLDKNLPGPDHSSSITPDELKSLVEKIRRAESSLGSAEKAPTEIEKENAVGVRRSIVASRNIKNGEIINEDNITFKRPATGLSPRLYDRLIGKKAARDISSDEILQMDMVQW